MNKKQVEIMGTGPGFIAALDQSGGSTPKTLAGYGIPKEQYGSEDEMFELVHAMRSRVITSPAFTSEHILGAILFEQTMDRTIEGMPTVDYLWEKKGILSFLKVDKGLADEEEGVRLMKPITDLDDKLDRAVKNRVFGTKMRSVINKANPEGIRKIVDQQFEYGKRILAAGLIPILEPEIDIHSEDKAECELLMKAAVLKHLDALPEGERVMLKLTLPDQAGLFSDLVAHPHVLRVVALSGGYSREEAVRLLALNPGLIASFSRALLEGLTVQQSDEAFHRMLGGSIQEIYQASTT
ncbi:fructose bisphosphate aldolase [Anaerotalea alkaliphila]|uniref:fructose-bisphosphate aldolase n=1 Tax=Anaerotalea alkaliphila TaxID=2662126 RepID=A0A7X5HUD7_9FIRM|nr:fructose bisphosphate aldolase [Anaerotalea alkaliphila]NDL66808.1 fructose bisphosphate aldolase [Anaerotalea alkaliphila]